MRLRGGSRRSAFESKERGRDKSFGGWFSRVIFLFGFCEIKTGALHLDLRDSGNHGSL